MNFCFFCLFVFSFFISEKQIQILFQEPCAYIAIIWFLKASIYWLSCIPFSFFIFYNWFLCAHAQYVSYMGLMVLQSIAYLSDVPKGQFWSQDMTDNLQYQLDSERRQSVVHLMTLLLCLCVVVFWQWTDVFLSANSRDNWIHAFAIILKCLKMYWFWVAFHGLLVTTLYIRLISKHINSSTWTCSWSSPFWLKVSDSVS